MSEPMGERLLLTKKCSCWATSSGPRVLISPVGINPDPRRTSDQFGEVWAQWVLLACDACDRPWEAK